MWQKVEKFKGAEYFRKALYIGTKSHANHYWSKDSFAAARFKSDLRPFAACHSLSLSPVPVYPLSLSNKK